MPGSTPGLCPGRLPQIREDPSTHGLGRGVSVVELPRLDSNQ